MILHLFALLIPILPPSAWKLHTNPGDSSVPRMTEEWCWLEDWLGLIKAMHSILGAHDALKWLNMRTHTPHKHGSASSLRKIEAGLYSTPTKPPFADLITSLTIPLAWAPFPFPFTLHLISFYFLDLKKKIHIFELYYIGL